MNSFPSVASGGWLATALGNSMSTRIDQWVATEATNLLVWVQIYARELSVFITICRLLSLERCCCLSCYVEPRKAVWNLAEPSWKAWFVFCQSEYERPNQQPLRGKRWQQWVELSCGESGKLLWACKQWRLECEWCDSHRFIRAKQHFLFIFSFSFNWVWQEFDLPSGSAGREEIWEPCFKCARRKVCLVTFLFLFLKQPFLSKCCLWAVSSRWTC